MFNTDIYCDFSQCGVEWLFFVIFVHCHILRSTWVLYIFVSCFGRPGYHRHKLGKILVPYWTWIGGSFGACTMYTSRILPDSGLVLCACAVRRCRGALCQEPCSWSRSRRRVEWVAALQELGTADKLDCLRRLWSETLPVPLMDALWGWFQTSSGSSAGNLKCDVMLSFPEHTSLKTHQCCRNSCTHLCQI